MAPEHGATVAGRQRESAAMVSGNYQLTVAVDKPVAIVVRTASVYLLADKEESRRQ